MIVYIERICIIIKQILKCNLMKGLNGHQSGRVGESRPSSAIQVSEQGKDA